MLSELTIRRPDDFHVHFRDGGMLTRVLPFTSGVFGRALVMPNTVPPVLNADDAQRYRERILNRAASFGHEHFRPMMTIKLTPETDPETIDDARERANVIAGKLYPQGVTTNSDDGWTDLKAMWPVFEAMEAVDMVLCIHGEVPDAFCLDREEHFVKKALPGIARSFPKLRIVLEHVTTEAGVVMVTQILDNVYGTITPHHLMLTLDDVIGGELRPHNFCKPIAKRVSDRKTLIQAAIISDKMFLGTDSAPHTRQNKECDSGCAGVFNAPVALPLLAEIFDEHGATERLEEFTSTRGASFYGVEPNPDTITLVREPWKVPTDYLAAGGPREHSLGSVVPFCAGRTLSWKVSTTT